MAGGKQASHPIKDRVCLNKIADTLYEENKSYYIMFELCINTGATPNNLVIMTVGDVHKVINNGIMTLPVPTGGVGNIDLRNFGAPITDEIRELLKEFVGDREPNELLFSREAGFKRQADFITALSKAYNQCTGESTGFTSTGLRKTFGYWYYTLGGEIDTLLILLNIRCKSLLAKYIEVNLG